jgi:putative acyl-CoA dehydrogenase
MAAPSRFDTHEVTNQSPPFADVDLFGLDAPLQDAVRHNGAAADAKALAAFGQRWGTAEMLDLGAPGQ